MRIHKSSPLVEQSHPIRIAVVGNPRSAPLGDNRLGKYSQIALNRFGWAPPEPRIVFMPQRRHLPGSE